MFCTSSTNFSPEGTPQVAFQQPLLSGFVEAAGPPSEYVLPVRSHVGLRALTLR